MKDQFDHVRTWVFDLDNTLYPRSSRLFDQMDIRMNNWIMQAVGVSYDQAHDMRVGYLAQYGTTLTGLMQHHAIDPDAFLLDTHELDLSNLAPALHLRAEIDKLPGRRIVFTNGSRRHADRVTEALGLRGAFDAHYGIEDAKYVSKPTQQAFDLVFEAEALTPTTSAMFEDMAENLVIPHNLGMKTVLVAEDDTPEDHAHVHHVTDDLADFLSRING